MCAAAGAVACSAGAPAPGVDAGASIDARPTSDATPSATCDPDHDGVVRRDELPLAPGRTATFRVALDAPVDTAGEVREDGVRVWDLSAPVASDADVPVELLDVTGTWYAALFPTATYATPLSAETDLLGVFELTDSALSLLGVVSPAPGFDRTELVYDPPAVVLELPLTATSAWVSDTTVTGLAAGVAALYTERYDAAADLAGELTTPFGTFPVRRVRVALTRTVGVTPIPSRSFAFVSECYATVATVRSDDWVDTDELTHAAELRRIAP